MSVSEWCQIVTAAAASVSFIMNAYLRHKNYVYSAAKGVSTWLEDKAYPGNPPLIPAMLFTDTNGNYWYRTPAVKLVRLRETYMDKLVKHAYVLGHVNA